MAALPSGTVTFLLTDVEGSTRLWEQAPDAMRAALARHDELFEEAVRAHGGRPIRPRGEGDSRFAVFTGVSDAVTAALALQRALADAVWPTPRPIKVRIGVHTGEAQLRDGDYYGSTVNRCARIRAIGHGGQTLLSEAAATLIRDDLPDGARLLDLGTHRLKDLARPEQVFQLVGPGLASDFPPLTSLDARPHNLPVQTTSLVGRDREAARIRALLLQDDLRLLTLTGPGGSGKTRLALHVGADLVDRFENGVFFVDFAPLSDPALVASTIARALGLPNTGDRLLGDLKQFLEHRSLLLILDNFEQILAGAAVVVELLTSSTKLKVMVTSRASLQVRGEHELEVPPLETPTVASVSGQDGPMAALERYPAVALFLERAQAVRPDFALTSGHGPAVATICARLDGLPLALELAAARIRLLTPEAMVRRLEHRLPLLTGGARDLPARQRTLRDTIAWSYDLLDETEQRLFRALSVFVGGFTLDAAEAVLGDPDEAPLDVLDAVSGLVARSLVRQIRGSDDEPRFGMLETIREYALEQLEVSGETARLRDRHLCWCADMLETAVRGMDGPEQAVWLSRVEDDHDNLRTALTWADRTGDRSGRGLWIAIQLGTNFWTHRGYHREGRAWFERLLVHVPPRSGAHAQALRAMGNLAQRQNDYGAASSALSEAIEIMRELGDRAGVANALSSLGVVPHHAGDFATAQALLEESASISRELGDSKILSIALRNLADLLLDRGEISRAARYYEESLALARKRQVPHDVAYNLRGLGNLARAQGRYEQADHHLRESLRLLKPISDRRCIPLSLEGLACITVGDDWAERAARLLGAAQAMQARTGAPSPPSAAADYRRTVADARRVLGPERFDRIWAEGAAMGLGEAVDLALAEPRQSTLGPDHSTTEATRGGRPQPDIPLSAREREVVTLIAKGRSNREIADALVLSVRTVERHIENVYNRLGISGKAGRAIVTAYAIRHHLTEPT
jgi:predicted ATPase/class 3 adenylate cyclase/DNA-binding CsgD family transcriptional regulator